MNMFAAMEMKQNTKLLGCNAKYISTFPGILNVCEIVIAYASIHLLKDTCRPAYSSSSGGFVGSAHETYFYLCNCACLIITCILLFSFIISHMSYMLMEKTILGVTFWSVSSILSFLTSLALFLYVNAPTSLEVFGYSHKVAAAILGFINSGFYLINALKSYRSCKSSWSYLLCFCPQLLLFLLSLHLGHERLQVVVLLVIFELGPLLLGQDTLGEGELMGPLDPEYSGIIHILGQALDCLLYFGGLVKEVISVQAVLVVRYRKLFVGGIDPALSEDDLREYFEKFGVINSCTIHRNRLTGRSRGFGFITFKETSSVDEVQSSRPHTIQGCEVTTKRAVPRELFQVFDGLLTVNKIFVGGLRQDILEPDLLTYFRSFGKVRKIDVMLDRTTNTSRGFAFVEFEDYDPVDKAVLLGSHVINGHDVTVRKAKSRLEMELIRHQSGLQSNTFSMRSRSFMYHPEESQFGLAAYPRMSVDSFDFPYHLNTRSRGRFIWQ